MSLDTTKENDSVVDSSVTEWKHDAANLDNQEGPNCKVDEDACRSGAEDQGHSCGQAGTSGANKRRILHDTRYFIIKSLNHENIQMSVEKGIWATQVMNEPILEEAYHNSGKVILIFSVNMSGFFQGYAQMVSSVGWRRDNVWSQGNGGGKPWGRSFKVKWLRLHDLPFQKTLHLKNPLNQYKPVKISRDCQELPQEIGEALCELLDEENGADGYQTRDFLPSERPCIEKPFPLQAEEYEVDPVNVDMGTAPVLYHNLLYQHQAEANRFHLAQNGVAGVFHNMPITSSTSEVAQQNNHCKKRNRITRHGDYDNSSRFDSWDLSQDRSFRASALTEDDIIDMTYEEYLEAHGRCNRTSQHPIKEPFQRTHKSPTKEECSDDSYSRSRSDKRSRHY